MRCPHTVRPSGASPISSPAQATYHAFIGNTAVPS